MSAESVLTAAERALTGRTPGNQLERLAASQVLARAADRRHRQVIIATRKSGATWLQMARALGLESKQAGKQAYDRAAEVMARDPAERS
jgi:hypothetical protein